MTSATTVAGSTASTLPKSSAVAWVAKLVKKCRKSRPSASAKASTRPIATSRCATRSPMKPIRMPAASVIVTRPQSGATPIEHGPCRAGEADMRKRMAGEGLSAQHEEIADDAGNDGDHGRGGEGIAHEVIFKHAMIPRARKGRANARRGNFVVGMAMFVPMRVGLDIVAAGHHENAALDADDIDGRAIELGEDRRRDHLFDRAERRLAIAEIEHLVDGIQQRVQFMRAEQHGNREFALQVFHELVPALEMAGGLEVVAHHLGTGRHLHPEH